MARKGLKILVLIIALLMVYAIVYGLIFRYDGSSSKSKDLDSTSSIHDFYVEEMTYDETMGKVVLPYVDSLQKSGTFTNEDHTIAYNMYLLDSPKANIVISHGFIERKEKYKEAIYYFLKMGYQVFILDHYSHGASSRGCADSSMIQVEDYRLFADDLYQFVSGTVKKNTKGAKTLIYGHSMGGAIAALTVEKYPDLVDGIILNAPMMKIKNDIPEFVGDPVAKLMVLFGMGKTYAIGNRAYNPETDLEYHPANPATFCVTRASYWHHQEIKLSQHPTTGASWGAAANFIDLTHEVVKKKNVKKINIPILLFQAERDGFVDPEGQYTFANNAKNIEFYFVKDAGHEIYIEKDGIIVPYFERVREFVEGVVK